MTRKIKIHHEEAHSDEKLYQITPQAQEIDTVLKKLDRLVELQLFLRKEHEAYQRRIAAAELEAKELAEELEKFMIEKNVSKLESQHGIALMAIKERVEKIVNALQFLKFFKEKKKNLKQIVDFISIPVGKLCKEFGETLLAKEGVISYDVKKKASFEVHAKE